MATINVDLLASIYEKAVVDVAGGGVTYYGFSTQGEASTSSRNWSILREQVVGAVTTYSWANGKKSERFSWDDRATYTY